MPAASHSRVAISKVDKTANGIALISPPAAPFTTALSRAASSHSRRIDGTDAVPDWVRGRGLPQTIGHRGYKAAHPENTMDAFLGAVAVGAHALETDVHLSKDKVVVLSHVR